MTTRNGEDFGNGESNRAEQNGEPALILLFV